MAPIHPVDFLFTIIVTTTTEECFFCDEDIIPETDYYTILVTIPGKKPLFQTHDDCFEQLAWSMSNFVFKHRGVPKLDEAMN